MRRVAAYGQVNNPGVFTVGRLASVRRRRTGRAGIGRGMFLLRWSE